MAALTKMIYETKYAEFYIDNDAELQKLPTTHSSGKEEMKYNTPVAQGSIARSASKAYILTAGDTWVEYTAGGGGGGVSRSEIWIGATPPPDDSYKIWIDISGNDPAVSGYTDEEVKDIINDILNDSYSGTTSDTGSYTDQEVADVISGILNGTTTNMPNSGNGSYTDDQVNDMINDILGG